MRIFGQLDFYSIDLFLWHKHQRVKLLGQKHNSPGFLLDIKSQLQPVRLRLSRPLPPVSSLLSSHSRYSCHWVPPPLVFITYFLSAYYATNSVVSAEDIEGNKQAKPQPSDGFQVAHTLPFFISLPCFIVFTYLSLPEIILLLRIALDSLGSKL